MAPTTITKADKFSYGLSIGMVVIYSLFPIGMLYLFCKYSKKKQGFDDPEYKDRFSLLSAGLRQDSIVSLTFPFVFFGRRLILIAMYIINHSELELMTFGILQIALIMYYSYAQPFAETLANRNEMIKESFLLALCMFMPIYTDYVPDPEMRFSAGAAMTYFFLFVVGLNVL